MTIAISKIRNIPPSQPLGRKARMVPRPAQILLEKEGGMKRVPAYLLLLLLVLAPLTWCGTRKVTLKCVSANTFIYRLSAKKYSVEEFLS